MSNRFAYAVRLENEIEKEIQKVWDRDDIEEDEKRILCKSTREEIIKSGIEKYKRIVKIDELLKEAYEEVTGKKVSNWYHISIRPDDKKINFYDFMEHIRKLIGRKCFEEFHLVFEQKGEKEEDLGIGFHAHIVAKMIQRSKGEVMRDIKSSLNKMIKNKEIAENCIQIDATRNPDDIIDKYLTNYESEDGHKELTKEMDSLWRKKMNLKDYYKEVPASLSIKSEDSEEILES